MARTVDIAAVPDEELESHLEEYPSQTIQIPQSEHPIIPTWTRRPNQAIQPWYNYAPALFGGLQWYNDTIDMNAKRAAQGW